MIRKILIVAALIVAAAFAAVIAIQACALAADSGPDMKNAREIGELLAAKFTPQSLRVTVNGNRAYAVMGGARLGGIRIEEMRLDAVLRSVPSAPGGDLDRLASLIEQSRGEITLLEKDVNDYYKSGADTSGFSELVFDFKPSGFQAKGIFSAQMLMNLKLNLAAAGNLALRSDGVYIDGVSIFAEGIKQPDMIVNLITGKINPLLPFKDIPFPVSFSKIQMTEKAVVMTGISERAPKSGAVWSSK